MIYSGGAIEDELPARDLTAFTLRRAPALGDKPALIDGITGRELSYAELQRAVRAFAAGLAERGFAKGDTFAIFMPNVPEYAIAFHGALAAGRAVHDGKPPVHRARARLPAARCPSALAADGAGVCRGRAGGGGGRRLRARRARRRRGRHPVLEGARRH